MKSINLLGNKLSFLPNPAPSNSVASTTSVDRNIFKHDRDFLLMHEMIHTVTDKDEGYAEVVSIIEVLFLYHEQIIRWYAEEILDSSSSSTIDFVAAYICILKHWLNKRYLTRHDNKLSIGYVFYSINDTVIPLDAREMLVEIDCFPQQLGAERSFGQYNSPSVKTYHLMCEILTYSHKNDDEIQDKIFMPFNLQLPTIFDAKKETEIPIQISSCAVTLSPLALYDWLYRVTNRSTGVYWNDGNIGNNNLPNHGVVLVDHASERKSIFSC